MGKSPPYIVLILAALLAATLFGCVRSLYGLFNDRDLVFHPELLGTWREKDNDNTWTFQKSGVNKYELVNHQESYGVGTTTKGEDARFEAKVGALQGFLFLDLYPEEGDRGFANARNDLANLHVIPVHTISRVWLDSGKVRLALLDNDWLKKMIDDKKVSIPHEIWNGTVILTASTDELQKFVVAYAEDTTAFPKPTELLKLK